MTTLQISLPDTWKEFLERQVADGGFTDAGAYVQSLLEQVSIEQDRARINALILEGIKDIESGNGVEMTADDWKQMREEYLARMRSRNGS